jgi:hypothetical protein
LSAAERLKKSEIDMAIKLDKFDCHKRDREARWYRTWVRDAMKALPSFPQAEYAEALKNLQGLKKEFEDTFLPLDAWLPDDDDEEDEKGIDDVCKTN